MKRPRSKPPLRKQRRTGELGSFRKKRSPTDSGSEFGSFRKNSDRGESAARLGSFGKNASATNPQAGPGQASTASQKNRFRVLVAVHRPRYRSRTERAMRGFDWEVRSLLNKEDAVGKIHQQPPHAFVISDDFGRQKDLGILRAVQRFRASGMKVVGLFEDAESARENTELCDYALTPPWKTGDMRETLTNLHIQITGAHPVSTEREAELEED